MEIKNLTPREGIEVQGLLAQMKEENPQLEWVTYPMGKQPPPVVGSVREVDLDPLSGHYESELLQRINELQDSIDTLDRKLERIFGGHVLMGGQFVKLT